MRVFHFASESFQESCTLAGNLKNDQRDLLKSFQVITNRRVSDWDTIL